MLVAVTEIVLQVVALFLRVLKPSFSIFQRARAARTSCTMLAEVGVRSVTQAFS